MFLYRYGKTIFDMIKEAQDPKKSEFEDDEDTISFDPFDFWDGANFKLKIVQKDGFPNYDKSKFEAPSPLSENDEEIEAIWNQEYGLQEFIDPKNFKTYEELDKRFKLVMSSTAKKDSKDESESDDEEVKTKVETKPTKKVEKESTKPEIKAEEKSEPAYGESTSADDEDDIDPDIKDYFKKMGTKPA